MMDEIRALRELRADLPVARVEKRAAARAALVARTESSTRPPRASIWRHPRLRLTAVAGTLACIAVAAALLLLAGGSVKDDGHPVFAAAAVEVAEANPRLLVTAPGWSIVHARGFEVDSGELIYGDGHHRLELDWYPARFYRSYLRDRAHVSPPVTSTLLGHRATTVHYAEANPPEADYATILAPQGKVFIEIRGILADKAEYESVLHSLRPVDVDTWLGAMPAEVLRPAARSAALTQMARGVPMPPGFDITTLDSESALTDRFILGKTLTGAIACDWLGRWLDATRAGNDAGAQEAVDALVTARHWPVLLQMIRERGYRGNALPPHGRGWPSEILAAAGEIARGHLGRGPVIVKHYINGNAVYVGGPQYPTNVLGCKFK